MNAITKEFTDAVEKQLGALNVDVKQALTGFLEAKLRLQEIEQKMARSGGAPDDGSETWGEQFVNSAELKAFADHTSSPARFRMDVKATITSGATSGGPAALPAYRDAVNPMPQRRLVVRDLLPVVQITTGAVEYPKRAFEPITLGWSLKAI